MKFVRHVVHLPRLTLQCLVTVSVVTITRCANYGRIAAVRRIFRLFLVSLHHKLIYIYKEQT